MQQMPLSQIAQLLGCSHLDSSIFIKGYAVDSRLVKPDHLFFALEGEQTNGHDYLQEAKEKGALAAIVSKKFKGNSEGLILLFVEDPLQSLQQLAKQVLKKSNTRVVAITGSVGKTTTKEFIKLLLSSTYKVFATPGNANSQIGLPLSILNETAGDEEIVILEMGMTEKKQISKLVQIAPPEIAVLTTVSLVHACHFASLQEIAEAKGEIFSHPKTKVGILSLDVPFFDQLKSFGACQKTTVSINASDADYWLTGPHLELLHVKDEDKTITLAPLKILGQHNRFNLLLAVVVARYFNVDFEIINQIIPHLKLIEKRLELVEKKNILFVNDSYNASAISMKAALDTLPEPKANGKKIAVLGSLLELGFFSEECHASVGYYALDKVEKLYCLGEECLPMAEIWLNANRSVQLFQTLDALANCLQAELQAGDSVLLKASNAKKMWQVLDYF